MSSGSAAPAPSVFISYASQDRAAARRIRDALVAAGLDAWYDESELGGGDVWDQKIRRQIRECRYFMPVISANTEARSEGYFRREWRLAVERTLDMADDLPFLVPVVLDGTSQDRARVPEKFLTAQWMRLPQGEPTALFQGWCARVTTNEPPPLPGGRRPASAAETQPNERGTTSARATLAPFPHKIEGQGVKHVGDILVWTCGAIVFGFRKLPKWVRFVLVVWLVLTLLRLPSCSESRREHAVHKLSEVDPASIKEAASAFQSLNEKGQAGSIIAQLAQAVGGAIPGGKPLLAVPFTAPPGETAGAKFAHEVFTSLYGALAVDGTKASLDTHPSDATNTDGAIQRARALGARYLLTGEVGKYGGSDQLRVRLLRVSNRAEVRANNYPITMSPGDAVADIRAHLPDLDAAPAEPKSD